MKKFGKVAAVMLAALMLAGCMLSETGTQTVQTTTLEAEGTAAAVTEGMTQPITEATTQPKEKRLVVIDPGHQARGNSEKEPNGPGSDVLKAKVSSGATGRFTGIPEYELNLAVSFMLKEILEARGYEVVMVRTTHDVNISNAERSQMANELNADIFVRIHANDDTDSSTNGILTICQTRKNPYNSDLHEKSYLLSQLVLEGMVATTGANKRYVWETDTMTGINWCRVPVTIVEMGFMSNETEDRNLATEEYRRLMAEGIANGIDRYFAEVSGG